MNKNWNLKITAADDRVCDNYNDDPRLTSDDCEDVRLAEADEWEPPWHDERIVRKAQIDDDGTQCGCFTEDYLKSGDALADCTQVDGHNALADNKLGEWWRSRERDRGYVIVSVTVTAKRETMAAETQREREFRRWNWPRLDLGIYRIRVFFYIYTFFCIILWFFFSF